MPPQRRWTFLVVPHGSDSPRSFSLSEKLVKRLAIGAGAIGLVAAMGVGVAFSHVALRCATPTIAVSSATSR